MFVSRTFLSFLLHTQIPTSLFNIISRPIITNGFHSVHLKICYTCNEMSWHAIVQYNVIFILATGTTIVADDAGKVLMFMNQNKKNFNEKSIKEKSLTFTTTININCTTLNPVPKFSTILYESETVCCKDRQHYYFLYSRSCITLKYLMWLEL